MEIFLKTACGLLPRASAFPPHRRLVFQTLRSGPWIGVALWLFAGSVRCNSAAWWPQFRGPGGSGVADGAAIPTHFGPNTNVVWKVALPAGNGSPAIGEDRLFLNATAEGQLLTLCLDRRTGNTLWQRAIRPEKTEAGSGLGTLANATPATDGERIYVYFGSFGLVAYDLEGKEVWRKSLPIPITQHGAGTSPIVAGKRVLLLCDQDVGSYLLAVDKATGETVWQVERAGFRRSFSTPLIYPPERPALAVTSGTLRVVAYDLADGSERWTASGLPNEMVSSPIAAEGLIVAAGWTHGAGPARLTSYDELLAQSDRNQDGTISRPEATSGPARQHFLYIDADKDESISRQEWDTIATIFAKSQNAVLAIRPDGIGDVSDTHLAWKQTRGMPYVPTPLCYQGRIYLIKNGGMLTCLDATTGEPFYQEERIGALGNYYASPVAAGGKICLISQPGLAVVVKAGETLEILAQNKLGEEVLATPAIAGHTLFVRTKTQLYAFGD